MNKLIFLVFLCPIFLFSQSEQQIQRTAREMKTMNEIYEMDKSYKKQGADAAEKILSFQNEVKDEIRKNRSKLSNEQYEKVVNYEKNYWQIVVKRRQQYSFNKDFVNYELPLLNKYRNDTLDYLYNIIAQ